MFVPEVVLIIAGAATLRRLESPGDELVAMVSEVESPVVKDNQKDDSLIALKCNTADNLYLGYPDNKVGTNTTSRIWRRADEMLFSLKSHTPVYRKA